MAMVTTAPLANSSCRRRGSAPRPAILAPLRGSLGMTRSLRGRGVDAGDARHRAEQVDEVGDVVGPHVEHRPAAGLVVEGRVRVPALVAGAHEEGGAADRHADGAVVDQLAAGLVGAAEKGVGGAADAHAALAAAPRPAAAASASAMPSGFSECTCLPAATALQADLDMRLGDGQVDDDLDAGSARRSSTSTAGTPNSAPRASAAA